MLSHSQKSNHNNHFNDLRWLIDTAVLTEQFDLIYTSKYPDGPRVSRVFIDRVFPHKRTSFAMELTVVFNDQSCSQHKRFLAQYVNQNIDDVFNQIVTKLKKTRRSQLEKTANHTEKIFLIAPCKLIVRQLGLDEQLNGLRLFTKPGKNKTNSIPALCLALDGQLPDRYKLLSHRLGKRCLFRCEMDDEESTSLIAKIYKSRTTKGAQTFSNMRALQKKHFDSSSRLRISQPIYWCSDHQILWMEDVQGKHLTQLNIRHQSKALSDSGSLLAKLHQTELSLKSIHTIEDEINILQQWVDWTAQLRPELKQKLKDTYALVKKLLSQVKNKPVNVVHRDFYDQQLIFNQSSTALIDFDTLALSYVELDIGNFLAHLKLRQLQQLTIDDNADFYFLSGYRNRLECDFNEVSIWRKASLLRLACLYSFRTQWKHLTDPLLKATYA